VVGNLGLGAAVRYAVQRVRGTWASDKRLLTLSSKYAKHPLKCRTHTSDFQVFTQVFVEREYSCLDDLREAGLIIDCGANVGYSSAYFLSRFPHSRLIAVEPDPGNFELLRQNLAPYGSSARALRAAVWSHPAELAFVRSPYRDGREWTRQVRECRPGEGGEITAVGVERLLRESRCERISLLKVDIEGAESEVFARGYESWIDRVDALVIELHDDSCFGACSTVFASAIRGRGFAVTRCGELTVCRRPAPAGPSGGGGDRGEG
jgi:FkbM family methyltransferase